MATVLDASQHYTRGLYSKQSCDKEAMESLVCSRHEDRHGLKTGSHPGIRFIDDPPEQRCWRQGLRLEGARYKNDLWQRLPFFVGVLYIELSLQMVVNGAALTNGFVGAAGIISRPYKCPDL